MVYVVECDTGCAACDVADDGTVTCTECESDYSLHDGACHGVYQCANTSTVNHELHVWRILAVYQSNYSAQMEAGFI